MASNGNGGGNGGNIGGWGSNGSGFGGMFTAPNFGGSGTGAGTGNGVDPAAPNLFGFTQEGVTAGLKGLLTNAAPYLQGVVGNIDQQMVEKAIRASLGVEAKTQAENGAGTGTGPGTGTGQQFEETVKVDQSGDKPKYRVDIVLGGDAKPESLKISRKDNVITMEIKTEKTAPDGSSRLYQEYTRKITLPTNVDLRQLESGLSPVGILTIQVPFIVKPVETNFASSQFTPIPVSID